jgi:DNA-binding transcriptional LysR family regulator
MFKIELRHLECFVAVAEELSFARAAERLHLSQPPLSRNIKQLEDELGVELFTRTTRSVQLTNAGAVYLVEAKAICAQMSKGIQAARMAARGEVGELTLGYEASSAYDVLPRALKIFRDEFPGIEVTLTQMDTDEQAIALKESRIDLGFVVPPIHDHSLQAETVTREQLFLALPSDHRLARLRSIDLHTLAPEAFILSPRSKRCGLYDQIVRVCRDAGFSPKVVQEANEMQIMLGFIAAGIGITLLPAHAAELQRPGVTFRPVLPKSASVELALAWRREESSVVIRSFVEVVKRCASEHVTSTVRIRPVRRGLNTAVALNKVEETSA